LSIDRDQIASSLKSIYGTAMETEGYLRRFIDLSYGLPHPSTEAFCKALSKRFDLEAVLRKHLCDEECFVKRFPQLAKTFNLGLRTQEQCFTEFNLVIRTTPEGYKIFPEILSFLVAIKAHSPRIYGNLRLERIERDDFDYVFSLLNGTEEGRKYLSTYAGTIVEADFILAFLPESEQGRKKQEFAAIAESSNRRFQISLLPHGGFLQVLLTHYMVSVENGPGFVPGDLHGNSLGDPGSNHIPNRGATEIMQDPSGAHATFLFIHRP
jgi:hypothetical protein